MVLHKTEQYPNMREIGRVMGNAREPADPGRTSAATGRESQATEGLRRGTDQGKPPKEAWAMSRELRTMLIVSLVKEVESGNPAAQGILLAYMMSRVGPEMRERMIERLAEIVVEERGQPELRVCG